MRFEAGERRGGPKGQVRCAPVAGNAMSDCTWSLHPQLQADTLPVGDLPLSRLLAINDANYPWLILVPRRTGVTEIEQLGEEGALLMGEITRVSRVLKAVTAWIRSILPRSAMWCRSCTSTSSRAGTTIRCGRGRSGALRRRGRAMRPRSHGLLRLYGGSWGLRFHSGGSPADAA